MFKLGLAQCCHPADGDVIGMARSWMQRAVEAGVDMLVFPESLMTPYELSPDEFAEAAEPIDGPFCTAMNNLARDLGLWVVYTANERGPEPAPESGKPSRPFNTAVMVDDAGTVRGTYRKVHLFDTDFTLESDKVSAGSALFTPVATPFGRIGMGICYDVRFPELARSAALAGCDVLLFPAAWVDGPRKVEHWRTLLKARAIENELFVAGLSRCDRAFGAEKRDYAGHSCVFGPVGEEVAALEYGEGLLVADIDLDAIGTAQAAMPVLSHRRPDVYA